MRYNFANLSDDDFEKVVRDCLQVREGVAFESFASGADEGIDLRYASSEDGTIIVQCKHYLGSTFAQLKSAVGKELPKIQAMKPPPNRYILATSQRLSPANKQALRDKLNGFIKSLDDVLGADDLENIIVNNPEIERAHFKLWLTSGDVLARIANAAIANRSDMSKEKILAKAKLFVPHPALAQARDILRDHRVCIISGQPGVGKTTLAEMLALEYMADEFELVVLSRDVEEAEASLQGDRRQLFFYDDFLGRTRISENFNKNEDSRLMDFIEHIKTAENKRLILTTREYILNAARTKYDRLNSRDLDLVKTVLEVGKYSRAAKAQMIYNHFYWDERVTRAEVEALTHARRYEAIIDHPNFNPRMVETALTMIAGQGSVDA